MTRKKVVVFGASGFIGSNLCYMLISNGYHVVAADNGYKSLDSLLPLIRYNRFTFKRCDITNEDDVKNVFADKSITDCILLSGIVGLKACEKNKNLTYNVNILGWKNVCVYRPTHTSLIASSTGSIYGIVENGLCTEETVPNPQSHYAITKWEGEKFVVDTGGIALRFATAAGPSPNHRLNLMPNQLVYEALENKVINIFEPESNRTFIHCQDFCRALIHFMERYDRLEHQIYNIGSESLNVTKGKLAEIISQKTGCLINIVNNRKDVDARNYRVDTNRMKEEGFSLVYNMDDIVDDLIKVHPLLNIGKYN